MVVATLINLGTFLAQQHPEGVDHDFCAQEGSNGVSKVAGALAAVGLFASGMVFARERSLTTHRSRICLHGRPADLPLPNRPSRKARTRTSLLSPTTWSEITRRERESAGAGEKTRRHPGR